MTEAKGFKKRLEDVKSKSQKIKLMFQYPGRAIKKSGYVISVEEDCFTLDDIYDGEVTFSYQYLVEVMVIK